MMDSANRFMRIILFFDLPVTTAKGRRAYKKFVNFLITEGFIRIQYSVYCKLCINSDSANTVSRHVKNEAPEDGDIRFMIITEPQYQGIVNVNDTHSLQEQIITDDRTIMIGGMNDEN